MGVGPAMSGTVVGLHTQDCSCHSPMLLEEFERIPEF